MSNENKPLLINTDIENRRISFRALPSLGPDIASKLEELSNKELIVLKNSLIFVSIYLLIGIITFSFVLEKWTIIDSLFFLMVTITTIGYGDLNPTTDYSRAFTTLFALIGIAILGFTLGVIGSKISDSRRQEIQEKRLKEQKKLMSAFSGEKKAKKRKEENQWQLVFNVVFIELSTHIFFILMLIAMALAIGYYEGWSVITSIYFAAITATTTGYGDIEPTSQAMRLICSLVFLPYSVCVMGSILSGIDNGITAMEVKRAEQEFFKTGLELHDIRNMNTEKEGKVSKLEFLKYMLVVLKKVDDETLTSIMDLFEKLEPDENGDLNLSDITFRRESMFNKLTDNPSITTV